MNAFRRTTESELFGHAGAHLRSGLNKQGIFDAADQGNFLRTNLQHQFKPGKLRFIQERNSSAGDCRYVDVRLVSSQTAIWRKWSPREPSGKTCITALRSNPAALARTTRKTSPLAYHPFPKSGVGGEDHGISAKYQNAGAIRLAGTRR
jgi:hypothetical protein